jgi:hypothetical protein
MAIEGTAVIHHTVNRIRFQAWPVSEIDPYGQLFNSEVEIRWQPDATNGAFAILVISEKARPELLQAGWRQQEMTVDGQEDALYLWGKHWQGQTGATAAAEGTLPSKWVQAEIEADLDYPVEGGQKRPLVQVFARTYRQDGITRLVRFVRAIPVPDKERRYGTQTQL